MVTCNLILMLLGIIINLNLGLLRRNDIITKKDIEYEIAITVKSLVVKTIKQNIAQNYPSLDLPMDQELMFLLVNRISLMFYRILLTLENFFLSVTPK